MSTRVAVQRSSSLSTHVHKTLPRIRIRHFISVGARLGASVSVEACRCDVRAPSRNPHFEHVCASADCLERADHLLANTTAAMGVSDTDVVQQHHLPGRPPLRVPVALGRRPPLAGIIAVVCRPCNGLRHRRDSLFSPRTDSKRRSRWPPHFMASSTIVSEGAAQLAGSRWWGLDTVFLLDGATIARRSPKSATRRATSRRRISSGRPVSSGASRACAHPS